MYMIKNYVRTHRSTVIFTFPFPISGFVVFGVLRLAAECLGLFITGNCTRCFASGRCPAHVIYRPSLHDFPWQPHSDRGQSTAAQLIRPLKCCGIGKFVLHCRRASSDREQCLGYWQPCKFRLKACEY
jgi:hypothetical protein